MYSQESWDSLYSTFRLRTQPKMYQLFRPYYWCLSSVIQTA
jgi:hypothetical protein